MAKLPVASSFIANRTAVFQVTGPLCQPLLGQLQLSQHASQCLKQRHLIQAVEIVVLIFHTPSPNYVLESLLWLCSYVAAASGCTQLSETNVVKLRVSVPKTDSKSCLGSK